MQANYSGHKDPEPVETRIHYFLPGQVILQFEHLGSQEDSKLATVLKEYFNENSLSWRSRLIPPDSESILLFKGKDNKSRTFSIAPLRTKDEISDKDLVTLLLEIDNVIKEGPLRLSEGFTLKSVSPNWLMGGTPDNIGGGGPGSWPVPADDLKPGAWPQFTLTSESSFTQESDKSVHVAILDTAPRSQDLDDALAQFGENNPLLNSIWGGNNKLDLNPDLAGDPRVLDDYIELGHPYKMSDHGLFVAGIIRTIAPAATLHLIEVLNPYGVGTYESIAKGLLKAVDLWQNKGTLIINLSLMLVLPREGHIDRDFPVKLKDAGIKGHMIRSFKDIFDFLDNPGTSVVAAAGNDAHGVPGALFPANRPVARYPAAFTNVIGVGAMPRQDLGGIPQEAASYSNLSDDTPPIGYITLGGEPGVGQGVPGLFISEFPEYCGPLPLDFTSIQPDFIRYRLNKNGWAWWAGTSFATPIISGLLAAHAGGLTAMVQKPATQVLDGLAPTNTTAGEKKIIVVQT